MERGRKPTKKFDGGPESERIQKLLDYCAQFLTPCDERFLKRLKNFPQWEEEFKGINDFDGVKWLIEREKFRYINFLEEQNRQLAAREGNFEQSRTQEGLLPRQSQSEEVSQEDHAAQGNPPEPERDENLDTETTAETIPSGSITKKLISIRLPVDLIDRVRDAVFHTPGITICDFAEEAFNKAMKQMEQSRGEPFPKRTHEIKRGRPIR